MEPKSVSFSKTTLTELMIPAYANFGGKIHGGILLSLMDKVAYACASKHAGSYVVTVSVEGVDFLQPVNVGELVSLHASINYVGKSSMVVGIKVISEDVKLGLAKHTNTSYFTMVAKNEQNEAAQVPPLILENKEEVRRFLEAIKRKNIKQQNKEALNNEKNRLNIENELPMLDGERVILNIN